MAIAFWFLAVIGAAVAGLAVVAGFALAFDTFLDWRHAPHQRSFYEGHERLKSQLMHDSWWFSESPETMTLLQDLSRGLSVDTARDKWRRARKEIEMPVDPNKR
jgi:hypothetical protein